MKARVIKSLFQGEVIIVVAAKDLEEAKILNEAVFGSNRMPVKDASLYAEVGNEVLGITAGREDGQVLVGPMGEEPVFTLYSY